MPVLKPYVAYMALLLRYFLSKGLASPPPTPLGRGRQREEWLFLEEIITLAIKTFAYKRSLPDIVTIFSIVN